MDEQSIWIKNRFFFAVYIGVVAGLIWGGIKIAAYYLGFTKVIPAFLAQPFFGPDGLDSWRGHMLGWLYIIIASLVASIVYALLFHKVRGPWLGLAYGFLIWLIVYGWIGPATGMTQRLQQLDLDSAVTDAGLFILWGVFIGYTIAFHFAEKKVHTQGLLKRRKIW
jgi:uncharacterized membrane protein YagU involved in acid resistance